MVSFLLGLCLILVIIVVILLGILLKEPRTQEAFHLLMGGIKKGLKGCGFKIRQHRYPVELYVWVTRNDEEVCEDCRDRASWPPMDIADWMKEGIPGTPEAETECGAQCRCKLMRYRAKKKVSHVQ